MSSWGVIWNFLFQLYVEDKVVRKEIKKASYLCIYMIIFIFFK